VTDAPPGPRPLTVWPVLGLPEVRPGDDLAALLVEAASSGGLALAEGDVVVVSSKVVSKAAGLVRTATTRADAVGAETVREVARRSTAVGDTVIVEARSGPVMAAAGIDASNTPDGQLLLLPEDPDAAARELRARIRALVPDVTLGVVVADTAGRPWRDGVTDFALGAAGVRPLEDLRGRPDSSGRVLEVTVRAIADELAAAADLVKGKLDGVPAAVVRGAGGHVIADDGPGAAAMLRGRAGQWWQDWFRYGHVEAVRAALRSGERIPSDAVPAPSVGPETVAVRAHRALHLAIASAPAQVTGAVTEAMGEVMLELDAGSPYALGAVVARLQVALWSEHLCTSVPAEPEMQARFTIRELVD
jgi:coenzyme F420-0:L-glutamate ligase / coenzyme F420-1:gamma-L-glutamate ligase